MSRNVVVWRQSNRQFVNKKDNSVYRGLHPLMKATCWPSYSFFAELAQFKQSKRYKTRRARELSRSTRPLDTELRSRGLGTSVHEQLKRCVDRRILPGVDANWHLSKRTLLSPTVALLERLHSQKLTPRFSEFVVSEHSIRLATSIDLICVNYEKKLMVLIEVKVGYYDGMMMFSTRKMNRRYSSLACSPYYMAALQIVCGKQMFMQQLSIPSNVRVICTVAHLTGTSTKLYFVNVALERSLVETYSKMVDSALVDEKLGRRKSWRPRASS